VIRSIVVVIMGGAGGCEGLARRWASYGPQGDSTIRRLPAADGRR
jgi:hypothetical protein